MVHDHSGYGNNGSVSGATFRASNCGGAYEFDGIDDFIFIPQSASLSVTGSLTLAAWMRVYSDDRQRPLLEWNDGIFNGVHMWRAFRPGERAQISSIRTLHPMRFGQ